ncbi:hypothetical protein AB1046_08140 [Promicromonospora sp. Populi]|uniref:hypothetical protein n=1 Tax=Promicromonospora sp. Populi TaxID=3239420 RepID=UPI0034E24233
MSTAQGAQVAAEIEAAVRAVPGVADLYGPGSLVSNVVDVTARHLGLRDTAAPLVLVRQDGSGIQVEIAMAVHSTAGATVTSHTVHRVVRDLLTAREQQDARIVLTVVHVPDIPLATEAGPA